MTPSIGPRAKGMKRSLMEQAGLILRKEGSDHYYDRFRGRLIFPICDEQGRVIGFSGRILSSDVKAAKYVNSPETPIFTKGKVFFGMDKSKRALLDAQSAIVCEGQLDLIACYMGGVQNVVAPQGTALTMDHARILKRYVDEVVLCFDSDKPGKMRRSDRSTVCWPRGLAIRVAVVPSPHDPDSFIKESGGAAFRELIEQADGFFDYYLNRLCLQNDLGTDKGRLAVLQDMAQAVHKTGNVVFIDTYAQKTALRLGVSAEAVRAEFRKASRLKSATPSPEDEEQVAPAPELVRPATTEYWLLKLILMHEETVEWLQAHLDLNWIQHALVRQIISQRFDAQADGAGRVWRPFSRLRRRRDAELDYRSHRRGSSHPQFHPAVERHCPAIAKSVR